MLVISIKSVASMIAMLLYSNSQRVTHSKTTISHLSKKFRKKNILLNRLLVVYKIMKLMCESHFGK